MHTYTLSVSKAYPLQREQIGNPDRISASNMSAEERRSPLLPEWGLGWWRRGAMGKVCWKPRLRAISRRAEGGGWGPQGPQMPGSSWTGREWARHHGGHRGDLARVSTEHGWQHWGAPGATVSAGGPCPTADAPAMAAPRGTPDLPPLPDLPHLPKPRSTLTRDDFVLINRKSPQCFLLHKSQNWMNEESAVYQRVH